MESFLRSPQSERIHHRVYSSRADVHPDLFCCIEGFHNRCRRRSSFSYLNQEAYGHLHHQKSASAYLTLRQTEGGSIAELQRQPARQEQRAAVQAERVAALG